MKIMDETLQELWPVKDNLAKELAFDLDSLVDHLSIWKGARQQGRDKHLSTRFYLNSVGLWS